MVTSHVALPAPFPAPLLPSLTHSRDCIPRNASAHNPAQALLSRQSHQGISCPTLQLAWLQTKAGIDDICSIGFVKKLRF